MKFLQLSVAICLMNTAAQAQAPKWDSTYRPGNYKQKLDNFKNYPNAKSDIVF